MLWIRTKFYLEIRLVSNAIRSDTLKEERKGGSGRSRICTHIYIYSLRVEAENSSGYVTSWKRAKGNKCRQISPNSLTVTNWSHLQCKSNYSSLINWFIWHTVSRAGFNIMKVQNSRRIKSRARRKGPLPPEWAEKICQTKMSRN